MRFLYVLSALAALAYAAPGANDAVGSLSLEKRQCLPSSCKSQGCCSGKCGYWCDECGIDYNC